MRKRFLKDVDAQCISSQALTRFFHIDLLIYDLINDLCLQERMIQKKVQGTRMKQKRITARSYSRTSAYTVLIALILAGLSSIKVISSCVISPSESIAIAGDLCSFSCNARTNNQQEGSILYIKLGSDGTSGTDIFRPPSFGPIGEVIHKQHLAEGYFLSHLDGRHGNVIIQINETQLKHGGQYFCSCVESTSKLGTANFTVLDKLSFVRSGDEALTPGTLVDLNCSVSFNGSTSSAFIDLTISDANGIEVSSKRNLSLTKNVTGHHAINYKVIVDPKEQRFTCEVKVWNTSSPEGRPLHSLTSELILIWDKTPAPQKAGRTALIAIAVIAVFLMVAGFIAICIYKKCHTGSIANGTVIAHPVGKRSPTANQGIRYKDTNLSIQHPPHMMSQYSEVKKQRNATMAVNEDAVVVDNDIYEASSDDGRKTEQIYIQVL